MYCVFLITNKSTKEAFLEVFSNEREVPIKYSPRVYMLELLEKQSDAFIAKQRVELLKKSYNIHSVILNDIKKAKPANHSSKPGPKPGSKLKISEEDRQRRKNQFSRENHPNVKRGFSEDHRRKLSEKKLGRPSNRTGKPCPEHTKAIMSEKMKGKQGRLGTKWIYNHTTGEERVIKDGDTIPDGFRIGRNKDVALYFFTKKE